VYTFSNTIQNYHKVKYGQSDKHGHKMTLSIDRNNYKFLSYHSLNKLTNENRIHD